MAPLGQRPVGADRPIREDAAQIEAAASGEPETCDRANQARRRAMASTVRASILSRTGSPVDWAADATAFRGMPLFPSKASGQAISFRGMARYPLQARRPGDQLRGMARYPLET